MFGLMVAFLQVTQRAAEAALQDTPITSAQYFILRTLRRTPQARQVDLAEALGVTPGNISQLLAKLEAAGLVQRTEQRRSNLVALTHDGAKLLDQLEPRHDDFLRGRFGHLDKEERRTLLRLLEKLATVR